MIKNKKIPWMLLTPALAILVLLVLLPIARTFVFSLYDYKLTAPNDTYFIGLKNYIDVLKSDNFFYALQNSALVLAFVVVIALVSSIIVGLLLNVKSSLSPLLTAVAIIPWALPPIVNGIIWKFIFYPGYGLMNKLLISIGLTDAPISWTAGRLSTLFVVSVIVAWRVIPFCSIIILANLQNIPGPIYEAADIDGSSKFQTFIYITLPLLLPSIPIILIQITMAAINVFDELVALIGYRFEGQTLLIYNYLNTFSFLDFGLGSAITYIIMILSGVIGFFYIKTMTNDGLS